jgi:starch-binding outer membrane protein, SusD/RagB family
MKKIILTAFAFASLVSCSKLDEKLGSQESSAGGASGGAVSSATLLASTYEAMRGPYQGQDGLWCTQEHTSDEAIGPTRSGDWDDNGIWRTLHAHTWSPSHEFLASTFTNLGKVVFAATDLLRSNPTPVEAAEGRLLRAMAIFSQIDGWNQSPYREDLSNVLEIPKIRKGNEGIDYIISELNAIIPNLPVGPANKANKDAARLLLMKCYINKGVYANRSAPSFSAADMNQVIANADLIMGSTRNYTLTSNYFNNFAPGNDAIGNENVFTGENIGGSSSGNVRSRWFCTLHYNQNPSGWNGFTTLSDFYDKFETADKRRGGNPYPGMNNGVLPGFLIGQQFDGAGVALKDRNGAPLVFTKAVKSIEVNNNLEVTGIRVVKYPIDYVSGDNSNNDFVYGRVADVLYLKAEAILRGGTPTPNTGSFNSAPATAIGLVNYVRTHPSRGASALTALSLDNLIDERGREFYWEGTRRTDLVRFGKFLAPWQDKTNVNDQKRLLFPISNISLAANPNMTQNPGY